LKGGAGRTPSASRTSRRFNETRTEQAVRADLTLGPEADKRFNETRTEQAVRASARRLTSRRSCFNETRTEQAVRAFLPGTNIQYAWFQ